MGVWMYVPETKWNSWNHGGKELLIIDEYTKWSQKEVNRIKNRFKIEITIQDALDPDCSVEWEKYRLLILEPGQIRDADGLGQLVKEAGENQVYIIIYTQMSEKSLEKKHGIVPIGNICYINKMESLKCIDNAIESAIYKSSPDTLITPALNANIRVV